MPVLSQDSEGRYLLAFLSDRNVLRFKAMFQNLDNALFPNQFVNARLLIDTLKNTVLVPTAAIQHGLQQSTYVYVATATDPAAPEAPEAPAAPPPKRAASAAARPLPAAPELVLVPDTWPFSTRIPA